MNRAVYHNLAAVLTAKSGHFSPRSGLEMRLRESIASTVMEFAYCQSTVAVQIVIVASIILHNYCQSKVPVMRLMYIPVPFCHSAAAFVAY